MLRKKSSFIIFTFLMLASARIAQTAVAPPASFIQNTTAVSSALPFVEPFPLTSHPEADLMPALSPDGKWLAYVSRQNKNYDIWVKPAGGGLATALTTNTSDDYSPSWSPDGNAIAFISRRDDAEGDLYLLKLKPREDGFAPGKLQRLTADFARETHPAFSPDGKKIAYTVGAAGAEQIWLYEIKNKKTYLLTTRGGAQPAWSPDGKTLAISCPSSEGHQIYLVSSDTAQADYLRRQITFTGNNFFPSFSPEGENFLVQRREAASRAQANSDLAIAHSYLCAIKLEDEAAGLDRPSQEMRLTTTHESTLFPVWGNDGMIYYAADHYGNLDLWRLPESGLIPRFASPAEAFHNAQKIIDPEIAVLAFATLRFYFPDSAAWLAQAGLEIGRRQLMTGDTSAARKTFARAAQDYAGRFEAGLFAGLELAKLTQASPRLEAIQARAAAWPAVQAFCLLETGKQLQRDGLVEAALQSFQLIPQQYAEIEAACYEAFSHAAEILLALDRRKEAEACWAEIVKNYPAHLDWCTAAIERLLNAAPQGGPASDTLAAYQRVAQKYSAVPAIALAGRLRMADRLGRDGESVLADNEYRSLLDFLPEHRDPYLQNLEAETVLRLLRVQLANNDFPAAILRYSNFIDRSSDRAESAAARQAKEELTGALVRRGRLLFRAQDYAYALSLFAQARQFDLRHLEAHRGYVEAMNATGRSEEAVAEYLDLTARAPDNEILLYTLGLAYSYQGENDLGVLRRSCATIERALGLNYRLVPAYLTLSFNYEGIERLEQNERERKKGFFEKTALALPRLLDNVRRTLTFRPPKAPERWYERAIDALTIAIALNDESADPLREAQLALNLANNYYNFGEFGFENAYRYYRLKLQYDSTFTNLKQKAVIYERFGHAGWVAGKAQEAAPYLQQAVVLAQSLREVDTELRNLLRLALLYQEARDHENAIAYYRQFINASRRENRTENLAIATRNLAYNHQKLEETDEAVKKGQSSLAMIQQAGAGAFPEPAKSKLRIKLLGLPVFWWTLAPAGEESSVEGLSYAQEKELVFSIIEESRASQKEYEDAIRTLEQKAQSFRQRQYYTGEAVALNNLGNLWHNLRDFQKARDCYLQSFRLCAQRQMHAGQIINLINLGNLALLHQREGGQAAFALPLDSLLQASRIPLAEVALQDPRQKLVVLNTLGNLYYYSAQQNWSGASLANAGNGAARSDLQKNIQRTLIALQSMTRARSAYDSALALAQNFRLPREEVMVRRNLASLLMLAGDYSPAWQQLTQALENCLTGNFSELTWRVAHALGTLRKVYSPPADHRFAQESSRHWYNNAIAILEALPGEPEGLEQRMAEAEERRALYENAVIALADTNAAPIVQDSLARAALKLAERSHAGHFAHLLAARSLAIASLVPTQKEGEKQIWIDVGGELPYLRRAISQLRGELRKLEAEAQPRPKELSRVHAQLAATEKEYQKILTLALTEDPELVSLYGVQPVAVDAVQAQLPEGAAVLEYFSTPEELLIWLIAADRVEQYRVRVSKENLRQLVAEVRENWQDRRSGELQAVKKMAALLLDPIKALEDYTSLIVIPDESLHYLPFAALPYHDDALAAQFVLTRAPSLQAWQYAARHKNLNSENLLILADAGNAAGFAATQEIFGMTARVLRGADWRDRAAGERQQMQTAGVLHLQHNFMALPARPLDSSFILQVRRDSTAQEEQTALPVSRLFEFDLGSSLVVLENTHFPLERNQTGEEMIALQRSLIYAGAPSLVMGQWQTPVEVRALFYTTLYSELQNHALENAFNAAQLAVRNRYPAPADWAGFELIGFAGMTHEQKNRFAAEFLDATVTSATKLRYAGEHALAIRRYRAALAMAEQLGRSDYIPLIEERIKESAIAGKDFAAACEIETKILTRAQEQNDRQQTARSYRNLSLWQRELRAYDQAAACESKNLAWAEENNEPMAVAGAKFELSKIWQAAGDYELARQWAGQAARILAEQNQALPRLQVETQLGNIALEHDHYIQARHDLENALAVFAHAAVPPTAQTQRAVAIAQLNAGVASMRLAAYREAFAYLEKAAQTFTALSDSMNWAQVSQARAEAHWLNGDYQKALAQQHHAQNLFEVLPDAALAIRGKTLRGLILANLGETEQALETQKQALELAFKWEEEKPALARREQATVQKNLGQVYLQQKKLPPALMSFRQAAQLDLQLGAQRGLLYDYLNLGQTHQALQQADSALAYLARAESLAVALHDPRALAKAWYTEGLAHLQKNNHQRARAAWDQALAQAQATQLDEVQWRCLWQLGALTRQENDPERAWDFYARAIAALERLSGRIKVEEYRCGFIDDKSEIYEEAVLLLLHLKREAEALQVAECAKSRSFADLLANGKIGLASHAGSTLLARRERALAAIAFVQGQITALQAQAQAGTRAQIAALADSLDAWQRAYSALLVEMKTANPELADAVSVAPLPVAEVQAMLTDRVALVEYFFAKDRLVSWVVERTQVRAVATQFDRNRLSEDIAQFRKAIAKRASTESFAMALYEQLIEPVAPWLQNAKQLLLVPHGALHYLPFAALQRADSTYLIDTHALALAPSATVFGFCHRKNSSFLSQPNQDYRILALGNPDVGNPRLDLPFAEKEIKSLEQTFGEIISFTRKEATPKALLAIAGAANVLHFSCHGVYDERNPLFSALLLAPDSTHPTGRLEAHEIFGMKLNTSLVMLSACETGLARVSGGDEVIGLTRSFIFAGAPALIASLWSVDDLATAITVKRFYRYLKASGGVGKAQALREAQRFVRDYHNSHPAYWASFGLTGDWR